MPETILHMPILGEKKLASIDEQILQLLSENGVMSGEKIGEEIGTTRAYVWKRISALRKEGVPIASIHSEGYTLDNKFELLSPERIMADLKHAKLPIKHCWSIPSTNTAAVDLAKHFPEDSFVIISETQRKGRGRRGKSWQSPFGSDVYLSYKELFVGGAKSLQGLSLIVAIALAEYFQQFVEKDRLAIKWPNDLYLDGRKMGGILVEMTGDIYGDCSAVIGVGLNGTFSDESDVGQAVASVHEFLPAEKTRNQMMAEIIDAITKALTEFKSLSFSAYIKRWQELDWLKDKQVDVFIGDKQVSGKAQGINEGGALLLLTEQGEEVFHAGDVSVRPTS